MDYQRLLEIAMNENLMLRNSLNIYAEQAATCIRKMDAISKSLIQLQVDNENFITNLERFKAKVNSRTIMKKPKKK